MPKAARRASGTGGYLKPRGLTGNTVSAVPYRAPRTSARHTRDADGRPRPPDPGFRRVRRHRNDRLLRYMQRVRDRTKHSAANERCPDDSQLFHESFPSLQYGSQFIRNNASNIEHQAGSNLANLDLYQRWSFPASFRASNLTGHSVNKNSYARTVPRGIDAAPVVKR